MNLYFHFKVSNIRKKSPLLKKSDESLVTIESRCRIFRLVLLGDVILAGAGVHPVIFIWNMTSKLLETRQLTGHTRLVMALVNLDDQDKHLIASGSADRTICIWNVKNDRLLKNLTDHNKMVNDLAALKKEQLISCSDDLTIKIWNTTNG
jgi:WD40 repeat protein